MGALLWAIKTMIFNKGRGVAHGMASGIRDSPLPIRRLDDHHDSYRTMILCVLCHCISSWGLVCIVNVLHFLKLEEVNGAIVTVCPVNQTGLIARGPRLHLCHATYSEI